MTTFTASEVRELAATIWPDLSGREEVAEILHAYADRLEADDKAQPVTWVNPDDLHNPNFVGINAVKVGHEGLGKHYTLPLYTHPDPADAERLAEALRAVREWLQSDKWRNSTVDKHKSWEALMRGIDAALATHSTQAQPPAASVTVEMVERARSAFVQADDGSTGISDAIRAALLAAQENRNG